MKSLKGQFTQKQCFPLFFPSYLLFMQLNSVCDVSGEVCLSFQYNVTNGTCEAQSAKHRLFILKRQQFLFPEVIDTPWECRHYFPSAQTEVCINSWARTLTDVTSQSSRAPFIFTSRLVTRLWSVSGWAFPSVQCSGVKLLASSSVRRLALLGHDFWSTACELPPSSVISIQLIAPKLSRRMNGTTSDDLKVDYPFNWCSYNLSLFKSAICHYFWNRCLTPCTLWNLGFCFFLCKFLC